MTQYHALREGEASSLQGFRTTRALVATAILSALLVSAPAAAQTARPEKISRAILSVERGCPITAELTDAQRSAVQPDRILPILGAALAGIAGNIVTSGINAIGNALESASQEKAFVAEGVGSFTSYRVYNGGDPKARWQAIPDFEVEVLPDGAAGAVPDGATAVEAARCLVLALPAAPPARGKSPGPGLDKDAIRSAFVATGIDDGRAGNAEARLKAMGLTQLPALYVEAELVRAADGMVIQPVLIRYASPIPGAPRETTSAELHLSFAVPGGGDTTDIGTPFALARMPLPKLAPGSDKQVPTVLNRASLLPYASVVVPLRPTAGAVDAALAAHNGKVALIETNKATQAQLKEATRVAELKLKRNTDPKKRQELTYAVEDAGYAYAEAVTEGATLSRRATGDPVLAGSTNLKMRFVVIRDANEFGLAIARALKAQADSAGTAVTEKLKPKPEWTAQDTALVEAETAVRAAERAVEDAITAGKTADVPALQDAVTKAKAKANEAAVAAGHEPPYAILP